MPRIMCTICNKKDYVDLLTYRELVKNKRVTTIHNKHPWNVDGIKNCGTHKSRRTL